ncbi:MAG: hypothetical protein CML36_04965 [Rhodobacteraceae bacterium]|nr:hypothetical protein [Paracoccaceae bacterium]
MISNSTKANSFRRVIGSLETVLLLFLLLFFLIIKILFLIYAGPLPDEAYYWLWSKNVAISYFDHPPLATWVQTFIRHFSDNKYFEIRALPIISLGFVLIIMIAWQRYMSKKPDYNEFLKSVLLFLAFPIYAVFFCISFPDFLLITLLFTSSFCLFLYFDRGNNQNKRLYYWYLAVFLFSLALLTKYNAVLFGVGVLAYILYKKKYIGGPSYGHIIASTVIIFMMQTPVILWNLSNDFASFSFHLNDRLDRGQGLSYVLKNLVGFLLGVLVAFSPVFIFNTKSNFFLKNYSGNKKNFIEMGKFVLLFSVIFCLFLCLFTNVLYYWLTPAIVLLTPFLIEIIKSRISQYLHIFYGLLISIILLVNVSFYPISALFGDVDRETAILYGWEKIVDAISKEKKIHDVKKIVFSDYRLGSLYIFHSDDFGVDVLMEDRRTQFDIWRDKENSFGANTLIILDQDFPMGQNIISKFNSINFVRDIEIQIGNKYIKKYQVFLGTNT